MVPTWLCQVMPPDRLLPIPGSPARRNFCTVDANPRDAEDLVQEACKQGSLVPNATTLRTLDKIWAAHEQLHG